MFALQYLQSWLFGDKEPNQNVQEKEVFDYTADPETYFNLIRNIKYHHFGSQDSHLGDEKKVMEYKSFIENYQNNLQFVEKKSFTGLGIPCRKKYDIDLTPDQIIKSLKIKDDSKIKSIEMIIGGQRIDKIYSKIFNALRKIYGMGKDEIPFYIFKWGMPGLEYHEIKLIVELTDDCGDLIITGDIYHSLDKNLTKNPLEIIIFQTQWAGTEILTSNDKYLRVNFNQPMYYFLVDSKYEEDIVLQLHDTYQFKLLKIDEVNGIKIYALTKSLDFEDLGKYGPNFSRIDNAKLPISIDKEKYPEGLEFNLYGISIQFLRIVSGMSGLMFSK